MNSDNALSDSMVKRVISFVVAVILVAVVAIPVVNALTEENGSGGDDSQFNEGAVGAKLDYYTTSPTVKTVDVTNDGTNIVLSGDYSETYPISDMVLMASDKQSLCVKDGVMFYNDGTTTVPTESVTLTLDSSGLNGKTYEWVYFPTVEGKYGCYTNGYEYTISDAVSVASYNGISVIVKNGNVIDAPFDVNADPNTVDGKIVNYDIKGESPREYLTDGLWEFYIDDNSATIIKYLGTETVSVLEIPSNVSANGVSYNVTNIELKSRDEYFVSPDVLSNSQLILPNTLTRIGEYVLVNPLEDMDTRFTGSLVIPDSVVTIGDGAFIGCTGFTSLTLGSSVQTIGEEAFEACMGFTGELILPDGLQEIRQYAFAYTKITSVSIPDSVLTIDDAFNGCESLTNKIEIPVTVLNGPNTNNYDSGTEPYTYTYDYVQDNWEISIYEGKAVLQKYVGNVEDITDSKIIVPDSVVINGVTYPVTTIGNGLYPAIDLTWSISIELPDTITTIRSYAFGGEERGSSGIHTSALNIPENIEYLGEDAYRSCIAIGRDITIPASLKYLGSGAFSKSSHDNITVTFSDNSQLEYIGESVFSNRTITNEVILPKSVKYIGSYTFNDCTGSVSLDKSNTNLEYIGSSVFEGINIGDMLDNLPKSLKHIDMEAFKDCTCSDNSGNLVIPDSVNFIGYGAFSNCSGLTGTLIIPSSVKYIGTNAFDGTGLTQLINGSAGVFDYWEDEGETSTVFSNKTFESIVNLCDIDLSKTGIANPSIAKGLTTAGTIQAISNESQDDSDSGEDNKAMTNTIIKLIPVFLVLGLLIAFALPMVQGKFE